ncbi:MAG TPA: hypothetical protein VIL30_14865 [Ramlibacter sp.]|jgi:hypothetical protein
MPPFTITVHPDQALLLVEASGTATLAELCAYMDFVAALARSRRARQAVLNLLAVDIQFSFTDHLTLGAHAAQALHELERVASVVNGKYRSGTSEKAAQKSGLRLRTFTDLAEGLAWVAGDPLSPAP